MVSQRRILVSGVAFGRRMQVAEEPQTAFQPVRRSSQAQRPDTIVTAHQPANRPSRRTGAGDDSSGAASLLYFANRGGVSPLGAARTGTSKARPATANPLFVSKRALDTTPVAQEEVLDLFSEEPQDAAPQPQAPLNTSVLAHGSTSESEHRRRSIDLRRSLRQVQAAAQDAQPAVPRRAFANATGVRSTGKRTRMNPMLRASHRASISGQRKRSLRF